MAAPWRLVEPNRVVLGAVTKSGPLAWALSRAGGLLTGGGRVHAIEAIGLSRGMVKYFGLFFGYVNSLSRLKRADTELVILRTAWNCGSYYEWYQHVFVSGLSRLSVDDVERVALGPSAPGWDGRQQALLAAVDELIADRCLSDDTWARLREHYDSRQLDDLCMLAGLYAMLAMVLNSVAAEPEPGAWQRWPFSRLRRAGDAERVLTDLIPSESIARTSANPPVPPVPGAHNATAAPNVISRLEASPHFRSAGPARIRIGAFRDVGPLTWTLSRVGGFFTRTGQVAAADAIGMDQRMMRHYLPFAVKLVLGSQLTRTDTELATLRTTWNAGVRYEWYYHAHFSRLSGVSPETVERVAAGPDADGWNDRQRGLLTAVDELHADRIISTETWDCLRTWYGERELASLGLLVGHYEMLAMLFKSFGVEPEPGAFEAWPLSLMRRPDDSDRLMPSVLPAFNRAFTNKAAAPFAGRLPLLGVVAHTGRRSGHMYRTPVLVLRDKHTVMIPLPYGDATDWVRNVLAAGGAELRCRGRSLRLTNPMVVDRTGSDDLGLPARLASRVVKVLVADAGA
ncbi:MAG: hypothetical protein ACRD0G_12260 [Acidimicrobiales bacterium]